MQTRSVHFKYGVVWQVGSAERQVVGVCTDIIAGKVNYKALVKANKYDEYAYPIGHDLASDFIAQAFRTKTTP